MLIILAAVSIKAVLNMRFIDLASNAIINYAEAQGSEEKQLNDIDDFLQSTVKKIEHGDSSNLGDKPIAPTPKPEENKNVVITDITSTDIIYPDLTNLITDNIGKTIDYEFTEKNVSFSKDLSGEPTTFQSKAECTWYVWAEDPVRIFLISNGGAFSLKGANGFNNGVGLLDNIVNIAFTNKEYKDITGRCLKVEDLTSSPSYAYGTWVNKPEAYRVPKIIHSVDHFDDTLKPKSLSKQQTSYYSVVEKYSPKVAYSGAIGNANYYVGLPIFSQLFPSKFFWLSTRTVLVTVAEGGESRYLEGGLNYSSRLSINGTCTIYYQPLWRSTLYIDSSPIYTKQTNWLPTIIIIPKSSCTISANDGSDTTELHIEAL